MSRTLGLQRLHADGGRWNVGASIGGIARFFGKKLCSLFSLASCALQWLKQIENPPESAVNIGPAAAYFKRRRVGN